MTVLTEVQVWVLMGLFATLVAVMFTVIQRSIMASADGIRAELRGQGAELRAEIAGQGAELRAEIAGQGAELRAEVGGLRAEMRARFDAVDRRIDGLDRDVHMLVSRAVGGDPT